MNFKEALIAHFSGQSVQVKTKGIQEPWEPLLNRIANFTFSELSSDNCGMGCEFQLAPSTITVNGVEVPAPERVAPENGSKFYIPVVVEDWHNAEYKWTGCNFDYYCLEKGLVYLREEDMIARSKAMLIVKVG